MSTDDIVDGMHTNVLIQCTGPKSFLKAVMLNSKQGRLALVDIYLHTDPDVVLVPVQSPPTVLMADDISPEWKHVYLDEMQGWMIVNAWKASNGLVRVLLEMS